MQATLSAALHDVKERLDRFSRAKTCDPVDPCANGVTRLVIQLEVSDQLERFRVSVLTDGDDESFVEFRIFFDLLVRSH